MTPLTRRLAAEFFGTFILVVCGAGAIVVDGQTKAITHAGIALTFGLVVLALVYTFGDVSGCHINPAVTIGLIVAGKLNAKDAATYIVAQVVGALLGVGIIAAILNGVTGALDAARASGFAANGYGTNSPNGFNLGAVAVA